MNLNLTGKTALITGASKGLGHAMALTLAQEGMNLALAARSAEPLRALAKQIGPDRVLPFPTDLSHPESAQLFIDAAIKKFARIDLLVNNAGATKRGDFFTLTDQDWHNGYELKLHGAVRLSRAAWPHLIKTHGSIINIAGVGGRTGSAEFTLGGSVNAALMLFTKALADRGATDGVRVNAINPGSITTDRLTLRIQKLATEENLSNEQAAQQLASRDRIPRFGHPTEIADAVAFLTSDRAAYIHGAILDIDGGLTRAL